MGQVETRKSPMLLDDFTDPRGSSALGTEWHAFTDRVMGGRSELRAGRMDTGHGPALRMTGQVSLENNGGFIQVRLPLERHGGDFNASAWDGFALVVRGRPGPWYLHLKTRDTRRPWQYYAAALEVGDEPARRFVPFSAFSGRAIGGRPDFSALRSVGVAAFGAACEAEIEIFRVELAAGPD